MSLAAGVSGGGWALAAAAADPEQSWAQVAERWREGMEAGFVSPGGDLAATLGFWQESLRRLHRRPEGAPGFTMSEFVAPGLAAALGLPPGVGEGPLAESGPADPATWGMPLPILVVNAISEQGLRAGDDRCGRGSGQDLWELGVWDDGSFSPELWGFGPTNSSVLRSAPPRGAGGAPAEESCWGLRASLPWRVAAGGGVWAGTFLKSDFVESLKILHNSASSLLRVAALLLRFDVLRLEGEEPKFRIVDPPQLPAPMHVPGPLYAVDAGPCLALPVAPLLEPTREMDVIVVLDATGPPLADRNVSNSAHFPVGNFLEESLQYSEARGLPHPPVPDPGHFREHPELLRNNTFFGCFEAEAPALVYVPHRNETYSDETDLFVGRFEMKEGEQREIFENGRAMVADEPFQRCLLCLAQVKAEQRRGALARSTAQAGGQRAAFLEPAGRLGGVCLGCADFCWSAAGGAGGAASEAEVVPLGRDEEELPMLEFISNAISAVDRRIDGSME